MKSFEYHEPETIEEASRLLAKLGPSAAILAGGTDLIIQMKKRVISPQYLINIKKIQGLTSIAEHKTGYRIGALVLLSDLVEHTGLRQKLPIIGDSAKTIGSLQIRNIATIGGNLCNAAPSADMAPGLLALDAEVTLHGPDGTRTESLNTFYIGPGEVDLNEGEILEDIFVPFPPQNTEQVYIKHGPRRAMDCAVVGVAVAVSFDRNTNKCQKVRIALGAVAPTPIRANITEKILEGKKIEDISLNQIAESIGKEATPISDVRASDNYRSMMVSTLLVRVLKTIMDQTPGSTDG